MHCGQLLRTRLAVHAWQAAAAGRVLLKHFLDLSQREQIHVCVGGRIHQGGELHLGRSGADACRK
eukprot:8662642-Lingulodinium_polyedra.AAC.1